jgi:hypothetical protein
MQRRRPVLAPLVYIRVPTPARFALLRLSYRLVSPPTRYILHDNCIHRQLFNDPTLHSYLQQHHLTSRHVHEGSSDRALRADRFSFGSERWD